MESNIGDSLNPIVDSAREKGREAGQAAGAEITEEIKKEVSSSGSGMGGAGDKLGRSLGDGMSKGFARSRFNRMVVSSVVKISVLLPIIGAIVAGLSSLVSGLYGVIAALGTASASSVALLGYLGALGQAAVFTMIGFGGVGEAIKNSFDPKNAKKFNEAMKKLTPEARKFVLQIRSMKKGFEQVRDVTSSAMFPGIVKGMEDIRKLFPQVLKGAEQTGSAVGKAFSDLGKSLNTQTFKTNLGDLFASNSRVIETFGNTLGSLTRVVVALLDAAGPLTERFAKWFEGWADGLAVTTETANSTGRLTKYFEKAGDAMALVSRITSDLFEGLYEIGKIAQPMGMMLLEAFGRATKGMADYTDSAENVAKLETYFADVGENVLAISRLVKELGASFARLGADEGVKKTADALTKIVPELEAALSASIANIGPKLAELAGEILELFTTLEESNAVSIAIDVFKALAGALNTLLNIPGIGTMAKLLIGIAAGVKALSLAGKLGGFAFGGLADGFAKAMKSADAYNATAKQSLARTMGFDGAIVRSGEKISGFVRANKSAVVGMAAMGAVASGTADKVGLSGTAIGISAGSIGGAWGIAAGAIAGYTLDIVNNFKSVEKGIQSAKNVLKSNDLSTLTSGLAEAEKNFSDMDIENYWEALKTTVTNPIQAGRIIFDTDGYKKELDEMGQLRDDIKKKKGEIEEAAQFELKLGTKISFNRMSDEIDQYIASLKADGKQITLDLNDTIGQDTVERLYRLAQSAKDLKESGDSSGMSKAATQIRNIGKEAGLSAPLAQLLADEFLGVKDAVGKVPIHKDIKLTAETATILRDLGVAESEILSLKSRELGLKMSASDLSRLMMDFGSVEAAVEHLGQLHPIPVEGDITPLTKDLADLYNLPTTEVPVPITGSAESYFDVMRGIEDTVIQPKGVPINASGNAVGTLDYVNDTPIGAKLADIFIGTDFITPHLNKTDKTVVKPKANLVANTDSAKKTIDDFTSKSRTASVAVNIKDMITSKIPGPIKKALGLAAGGWVTGPGTSISDSIPAMLSNGEFVVKASQAAKYGSLLEAINEGRDMIPLPQMTSNSDTVVSNRTTSAPSGSLRIVSGRLSIDERGQAFITGVAEDVYNGNEAYNDSIGKM